MKHITSPLYFLKETQWHPQPNLSVFSVAFSYFINTVPHNVLFEVEYQPGPWTLKVKGEVCRLAQWLQAIDFNFPVQQITLPKDQQLWCFQSPRQNQPGNWFTQFQGSPTFLAIDQTKVNPKAYRVGRQVAALSSTVSDAYVDWAIKFGASPQYKHGGGIQYFIWNPTEFMSR